MIAYLRNRLSERSTWLGLIIFAAGLALFWFYRQDIYSALVTACGGAMTALAERFMTNPFRALLALIRPGSLPEPTTAAIPVAPTRSITMSLVDDFKVAVEKAAENAAMAALKAGIATLPGPSQAAANAVISATETPTAANITVAVADILAVVEAALATPVPTAPESAPVENAPAEQPAS